MQNFITLLKTSQTKADTAKVCARRVESNNNFVLFLSNDEDIRNALSLAVGHRELNELDFESSSMRYALAVTTTDWEMLCGLVYSLPLVFSTSRGFVSYVPSENDARDLAHIALTCGAVRKATRKFEANVNNLPSITDVWEGIVVSKPISPTSAAFPIIKWFDDWQSRTGISLRVAPKRKAPTQNVLQQQPPQIVAEQQTGDDLLRKWNAGLHIPVEDLCGNISDSENGGRPN